MNDLERFETFNPEFLNPVHKVEPDSSLEGVALEQLHNSIAQAVFWLEVAESWAKEYGSCRELFLDLQVATAVVQVAQVRAGVKD